MNQHAHTAYPVRALVPFKEPRGKAGHSYRLHLDKIGRGDADRTLLAPYSQEALPRDRVAGDTQRCRANHGQNCAISDAERIDIECALGSISYTKPARAVGLRD
jgi:hypothetical protein